MLSTNACLCVTRKYMCIGNRSPKAEKVKAAHLVTNGSFTPSKSERESKCDVTFAFARMAL